MISIPAVCCSIGDNFIYRDDNWEIITTYPEGRSMCAKLKARKDLEWILSMDRSMQELLELGLPTCVAVPLVY